MPVLMYGQVFKATFESNSLTADIGDEAYYNCEVVSNPNADDVNSSNYVLQYTMEFTSLELESTARYKMDSGEGVDGANRTQVYTWKVYFPSGCFNDLDVSSSYLTNIYKSSRVVVETLGDDSLVYDCVDGSEITIPIIYDQWCSYVLEVYYSYSDGGYYRMFVNNELAFSMYDINTMTAEDDTTGARILGGARFVLNSVADDIVYYADDMYLYDLDDEGVTLEELMPELNISNNVSVSTATDIETYTTSEYDTIFITQDITEDFTLSNSGTVDKPIHLHGVDDVELSGVITVTGEYIEIENCTITGDLIRE